MPEHLPPLFSGKAVVQVVPDLVIQGPVHRSGDRKSTRLNSSHQIISYAVFCLKKKNYLFLHPRKHGQSLLSSLYVPLPTSGQSPLNAQRLQTSATPPSGSGPASTPHATLARVF